MDDMEYDIWKNREEDYRSARRKRSFKSAARSLAAYHWDGTSPPILFNDLIPSWQAAVMAYYTHVQAGAEPADAWNRATPSYHMTWGSTRLGGFQPHLEAMAAAVRAA